MKNPQRFWVYLLYGMQVGPRTDVAHMTKTQLFESGMRFVTWGLIFLSVFWANGIAIMALYDRTADPHPFFAVVMFASVISSGMGFVGGLYLLVRSLFRQRSYAPPSLPANEDDA